VYGISLVCFATSYTAALGLEVWCQFRPRRILYFLGLLFGAAGLATQSVYLAFQRPVGWMLILAWVLAIFYLYGALHYQRLAWGVFVLPVILGLLGLSLLFGPEADQLSLPDASFWGEVHAALLLLAAVGVCVGLCASLMYLFRAWQLRAKTLPGRGLRLPSLERLEQMNRRAIDWSFPLLTAGVVIGLFLMIQHPLTAWTDPRVLSTAVLWLTFLLMVVLRYGWRLRGRLVALLTIVAFLLLVCCLVLGHSLRGGAT
jgi:ABC-type uncharacterized transport system permease subunit